MAKMAFLFLWSLCLLQASLAAEVPEKFRFTLNGKHIEPPIWHVEGSDGPAPGDITVVNRLALTLDEPGSYDFEGQQQDHLLYRVMPGGGKVLVACRVDTRADTGLEHRLVNMGEADLRQLRGVTLERWSPALEALLHKLDLDRVMVVLEKGAMLDGGNRLPTLPATLHHLELVSSSSGGFEDVSQLRRLRELRFLALRSISPERFDFATVEGLPLEYLSLPRCREAQQVQALGSLTSLKTLIADTCDYVGRADWLSGLVELRQLRVGQIRSLDRKLIVPLNLKSLEALPKLRSLDAAVSPVAELPQITLPALKSANLLLAMVNEGKVNRFAEMNPQCEVRRSLNAVLAPVLKSADRLKVRTGGLCHRREDREVTFHDTRDLRIIAELAAHLEVSDSKDGFHCMCCGEPVFEFYRGDELVAAIGFHHGKSIRWRGGEWPSDGVLTDRAAAYLQDWLARHGHARAKEEMDMLERRASAEERRRESYRKCLPWTVTDATLAGEEPGVFLKMLKRELPSAEDQATLFLKLLGGDHNNWSMVPRFEHLILTDWIVALPPEAVAAAIRKAQPSTTEEEGAARWIFGLGNFKPWLGEWKLLEPLARLSLSHPRQANRWRTMATLRDMGDAPSLDLLRFMLEGGYFLRSLPYNGVDEPRGELSVKPHAIDLPEDARDALAAALCLAALNDQPSKADVEKLLAQQPPEIQKAFTQSLWKYRERSRKR